MLGDGCTIDFPIRLHSKLKWSPRSFIKQDDGTVMPKARSFEEVLVVNLVKKRCYEHAHGSQNSITICFFPSLSPPSHHCPLLPITVPSFPSLSPPSHHCPLLPITVPSFPSLSPPSHHCPLLPITVPSFPSLSPPSHHCPLLPITVPSFPSLSPPSHHCPLLPITVPSFPSLSPPSHHSRYSSCLEQSFSLALRDGKSLHKTHN